MGRLLIVFFMFLPLIEIALFVVIGGAIGLWPTLLGVVVAAVAGALVLRFQGRAFLSEIRGTMAQGTLPGQAIADAMLVGFAGVLLLIPGYFSDLVGILLLIPPVRTLIYGWLKSRITVVSTVSGGYPGASRSSAPRTIELDEGDWRQR